MGRAAKTYIFGVIGAGGLVLACALARWSPTLSGPWMIFTALVVLSSVVKLRLPGIEGTYSPSFLFLLYGVAHFSLAETLIAGCAGALAQSLLNAKTRPTLTQVLFNTANVVVSLGACFLIGRVLPAAGMAHYLPAVMAAVAFAWFAVNTVLVSGVLSLLHGKPLGEVCAQWYVWSFPWYLVGVTLVGLVPAPGQAVSPEAWLILLPVVCLVHFFLGLAEGKTSSGTSVNRTNAPLPRGAQIYFMGVLTVGMILLTAAALDWQSQDPTRFVVYLALAVMASTFKIPLPRMQGTITPAFVLLLAAIAQLSFAETAVMAAITGAVQVPWRSARRPILAQVLFNPACLAVSAAFAWLVSRIAFDPLPGHSVAGVLLVSTLVLYGSNTVIVAAMLALVERKALGAVLAAVLLLVASLLPGGSGCGRRYDSHQPRGGLAALAVDSSAHGSGASLLSRSTGASGFERRGDTGMIRSTYSAYSRYAVSSSGKSSITTRMFGSASSEEA